MILSLDKIKKQIIKDRGLQECRAPSSVSKNAKETMTILSKLMMQYPEKIAEIEEQIKGDGEEFRIYFEDEDSLKELGEMRSSDPDRFYTILRKEELFLNTCLQTFGFHNYLVSLNPDKLFGEL